MSRRPFAIALVFVLAGSALYLSGCQSSPRQTVVVSDREDREGISALERGKLRAQAIKASRVAVDAWLAKDFDKMDELYVKEWVDYYRKLEKGYTDSGRVRVRRHSDQGFEAVDMDKQGKEALVRYTFKNHSHFTDLGGKQLTPAPDKETEVQLTLNRVKGEWIVLRIIGGEDELE